MNEDEPELRDEQFELELVFFPLVVLEPPDFCEDGLEMLEVDLFLFAQIFGVDGLDLLIQFLYEYEVGVGGEFGFFCQLVYFFLDFLLQCLLPCVSQIEISVVDSNLRRKFFEIPKIAVLHRQSFLLHH